MCVSFWASWGIRRLGVAYCNIPSFSPLQLITLASWSDGVIISPASGYGKWPHALFTHAKMLIDDSFYLYISPTPESFLTFFMPLSFNPLFWREPSLMSLTHSRFSNGLCLFDGNLVQAFGTRYIRVELGLIIHVGGAPFIKSTLFDVKAHGCSFCHRLFPLGYHWKSTENVTPLRKLAWHCRRTLGVSLSNLICVHSQAICLLFIHAVTANGAYSLLCRCMLEFSATWCLVGFLSSSHFPRSLWNSRTVGVVSRVSGARTGTLGVQVYVLVFFFLIEN